MNFPILSSLILLPTVGAVFILFVKSSSSKKYQSSKYVALFTSFANFLISIYLWYLFDNSIYEFQFIEEKQWLKGYVNYKVGIDGISILFILLTTLISTLCIISVNNSITSRSKEFLIAILVMESLMIGVFCSLDLVIFYLFFEGGLIPMFLIIGIWGGPRRVYSAFKFFLFTLLGSILMLVAIITIYKKEWSPITVPIYAILEGIGLGWISYSFNSLYDGIVLSAICITVSILLAMLMIYRSGLIKPTENFKLGLAAATGGIMMLYMINFVMSFFGSQMGIMSIQNASLMSIGFSLFVIVIAALNLVVDFDFIEEGAEKGAPKYMEWFGAFGLMVTLIWLYLEILRLLAKLRSR